MKKALIILGSIAGAVVLILATVFYATSGAVDTADSFFKSAAAGDMETAGTYLAEGFRSETSDEELARFLEGSGLLDYQEADWGGRSVDTSSGKLTGKVITRSGGSIPLTITFVREGGEWKIYHIQREGSGVEVTQQAEAPLPSRAEAAALVKATTQEFALAVNAKDMSDFHANLAREFQEQVSLDALHEIFAPFLTQDIDLTVLQDFEPMFTSDPALSAEGVLHLEGYYPTTPSRAYFDYTYVHRDDRWQLLGINVNVTPAEE